MKKTFLLSLIAFATMTVKAQLSTGDIAFVGFNADGDDDLAFVALEDIPANTTIYFCDSEWADTGFVSGEGDMTWASGGSKINAGTVITLNTLGESTISANVGTLTGGTGLSSSSESVFAFIGTGERKPTTFLAAIANHPSAFGSLINTGLQAGGTAIVLTSGTDFGQYTGPKTGIDKSGYIAKLNDMVNWTLEDGSGDQSNDGNGINLPFNTTSFSISNVDATAPSIVNYKVNSKTELVIYISEEITTASAELVSNYTFSPAINISTLEYNNTAKTVTITHAGLTEGKATNITVSNLTDLASNSMTNSFVSGDFYFNPSTPDLVITEIMYDAPGSFSDDLEFVEIYNAGSTAKIGGLQVSDEGNFRFTMPEMELASGAFILLATNKEVADTFYGTTFYDMVNGTGNTLGNGGELLTIQNSIGEEIYAVEYSDDAPWPSSADKGNGTSLELMAVTKDQNLGTSWIGSANFIKNVEGVDLFASPGAFTEVKNPSVSFKNKYIHVMENGSTANLTLELTDLSTQDIAVNIASTTYGTAIKGTDYTFKDTTYTFLAGANKTIEIQIPIVDNTNSTNDKFFTLEITSVQNAEAGSQTETMVYILENEKTAPAASNALQIEYASSYLVDANGSAEILAFDSATKRLFVLNSTATKVEVLDFSNPKDIKNIKSVDMTAYGAGATSVAVKNGLVVATVDVPNFGDGKVVFMDIDGKLLNSVTVGNLPDMVCFTPDGNYVLTANEGQPSDDYLTDPEGSVSMIDISNGIENLSQSDVYTLDFHAFDAKKQALIDNGVRIFGYNASVSQDVEPEYITISSDSKKAWVSLQENNAIATIDLVNKTIVDILPLGLKDFGLEENAFDASDKNDSIFLSSYANVKGLYMPDAIASYTVNDVTYVVTANEGDQREYDHIDEDVSIGDASYVLDSTIFPNANFLKQEHVLGRLAVSPYSGDTDMDGDFDELHAFGARSFSIWNGTTGALVYDSKNDFEKITALDPMYKSLFNASNSNNNFKNRSDNKGPEPEGVVIAAINGKFYAFVGLERVGGIMTYDITDPINPVFVNYSNQRNLGEDEGGDLGPEGIIYLNPAESPNDTAMVLVANEVSSTISIYYITNVVNNGVNLEDIQAQKGLEVYPNPTSSEKIYFNKPISFVMYNTNGQEVRNATDVAFVNIDNLPNGVYTIVTSTGETKKVILQ